MPKVTIPSLSEHRPCFAMSTGQVGVRDDGSVWYRTIVTATCLTDPGRTFSECTAHNCGFMVRVLPAGTKIELTTTE
jgi:hypothetical protein